VEATTAKSCLLSAINREVVLATRDQDVCSVPAIRAFEEAVKVSMELNEPITIRDPLTDKVFRTVRP
jgi:hypothetical protein